MKNVIAAALVSVAFGAHAHTHHDTLDVYSQYGHQSFAGSISVFDKEDAIRQVEINGAVVSADGSDLIFYNGFELYRVNWIWVGDDQAGHEFGYAADCREESDHADGDGDLHVTLSQCYIIQQEVARP